MVVHCVQFLNLPKNNIQVCFNNIQVSFYKYNWIKVKTLNLNIDTKVINALKQFFYRKITEMDLNTCNSYLVCLCTLMNINALKDVFIVHDTQIWWTKPKHAYICLATRGVWNISMSFHGVRMLGWFLYVDKTIDFFVWLFYVHLFEGCNLNSY